MCCWRRKEKFSWSKHVKNEEIIHKVKEERNILHTVKRRKAKRIGHILHRNCLLKHVTAVKIEGQLEVAGTRKTTCEQLLNNLKEKRGYWVLKKEALDHNMWEAQFRRGCGPAVKTDFRMMTE
jgi:hypothetical protein